MADVNYLYEPSGSELHWDGLKQKPKDTLRNASLSDSGHVQTKRPDSRQGMQGTSAAQAGGYEQSMKAASAAPEGAQKAQPRAMSPAEMSAWADKMLATQGSQNAAQLQSGASVGVKDAAGADVPAWLSQHMDEQRKHDDEGGGG